MEVVGSSAAHQRARKLRQEMTKPERLLWWALRANKTGFHFRRQHAAGPYILDFYCDRARLCVEVDGEAHELTVRHDARRDAYLRRLGIATLRVRARDVLGNLEGVVELIADMARNRPHRHRFRDDTSPKGEGL